MARDGAALAAYLGVVSSERRNISAMIRARAARRGAGWSVNGRGTHGGESHGQVGD